MVRRNKYTGRFRETDFKPLDLPFDVATLRYLLTSAASSTTPYTHQQIADWAHRFWWECAEGNLADAQNAELQRAAEIAEEVDAQWDLFLYNTYSLEQLQALDFSQVTLPQEWFKTWVLKLNQRAS